MPARYADWMAQAERDLQVARDNCAQGNFEWSAFQRQQAGEKAVKALRSSRDLGSLYPST
ncbi:MAG TPA: HEPN domain-containing protein [Armatimonadetes bacterium]|nr:HEPN domain-containing protein [Armatimonadota bacterium]